MENFRQRFIRMNAALLEQWMRHAADELHKLIPGSPTIAFILFSDERNTVMASHEVTTEVTELNASVSFLDAEGNPTTADDVPAWSSDNEAAATVAASEDGLSAVVSVGSPGAAIISVTSTNDDGSTAFAQGTLTVLPGDAVIGEVTFEEAAPA